MSGVYYIIFIHILKAMLGTFKSSQSETSYFHILFALFKIFFQLCVTLQVLEELELFFRVVTNDIM